MVLYGIIAVRVKDGDHTVNAAILQKFSYAKIIGMYGLERKQPVRVYIIAFQYLQGLFVQGDSDCLCLTLFVFCGMYSRKPSLMFSLVSR